MTGHNPWGDEPTNPWERKHKRNSGIDLIIRELFKKFKNSSNHGGQSGLPSKKSVSYLLLIGFILWLSSGIYKVEPDEKAVVLRFGEWVKTVDSGLHYHLPFPIEAAIVQRVTTVNRVDIGGKSTGETNEENLVLTGDSNIANVSFSILWRIRPDVVERFLFNTRSPELTVKLAAESVIREIIGQTPIMYTQTEGRVDINRKAQQLLQKTMDDYDIGIEIVQVLLQNVDPPAAVIDAFRDVERAQADQQSEVNKAEAYDLDRRARVRGEVAAKINKAEADKKSMIAKAQGTSARFLLAYEQYKKAPAITAERLKLETLSEVLSEANKVVVEPTNQGLVPYFPLRDLTKPNNTPVTEEGAKQ